MVGLSRRLESVEVGIDIDWPESEPWNAGVKLILLSRCIQDEALVSQVDILSIKSMEGNRKRKEKGLERRPLFGSVICCIL